MRWSEGRLYEYIAHTNRGARVDFMVANRINLG